MNIRDLELYSPSDLYYNLHDKLQKHVFDRSEECFKKAAGRRAALRTVQDLECYTAEMRNRFLEAMGGIPYDPSLPLHAEITGTVEGPLFRIEKVLFQSRPGVYVTANLYLPNGLKKPVGAVLHQPGHSAEGKAALTSQRLARYLAAAGLVVLAQDPVGQGERYSYCEPGLEKPVVDVSIFDHQYGGHQCFLDGDMPSRYFVADLMRGIDYLCSREEVDPGNIGFTGSSGGGTMTAYMMVCEPRLKAAAPGTFLTSRREYLHTGNAQDAEQIWLGATGYGFDHHEVLLCFAPKPVLILAVKYDFFAVEGTDEIAGEARRFWELYGKGENLRVFKDDCEHHYSEGMARQAARFFAEQLNGTGLPADFPFDREELTPLPFERLNCTGTGQVGTSIPDAKFLFHENLQRHREVLARRGGREQAEGFLREQVFRDRRKAPLNTRLIDRCCLDGLEAQPILWFSQEKLPCFGILFRPLERRGERLPVKLCLWEDGTDRLCDHYHLLRSLCDRGEAAFVMDVSGAGKCKPTPLNDHFDPKGDYGVVDRLSKDLFFLGDSLCALRTYDLLRAAEMLEGLELVDGARLSCYAEGKSVIPARIAKLLSPKFEHLETANSIGSLEELVTNRYFDNYNLSGYLMPGILRYFDFHMA